MQENYDSYTKKKMFEDESFVKADNGKIMMSLIEPEFIKGTAEVLTMGAAKYEIDNWKKCDDIQRCSTETYI